MMKKKRKMHLNGIVDLNSYNYDKEFQLEFFDYKKNLDVILHLPHWWIKCIAENLWNVIKDEQQELDKIKDSMRLE